MTYKKYLYLIIASMFVTTSFVDASVAGSGSGMANQKITIIGHTGQDPVYKSLGGKDKLTSPINKKPILIDTQYFDFTNSYLTGTASPSNWVSSQRSDSTFLSSTGWIDSQTNNLTNQMETQFSGGSIPAPPAFLLLISGFLVKSRRKP
ncbi:MAG: hypothetical protein QF718_05490 [Phycisphaerales bacterium]|nr:hypothetical protein [Phycisphaerales bacterium]